MRSFEWVPGIATADLTLPQRQTAGSAGYDLAAAARTVLAKGALELVPTGVRVKLPAGEFLAVFPRSSLAIKHRVVLANGVGVIDADYYGNTDNFGHIFIPLWNLGDREVVIEQGERIAQGVFLRYDVVSDERLAASVRRGGFGSTDQNN